MLSNNVTNGTLPASSTSTDRPFVVPSANAAASSGYQQLTVTVVATSDNAGSPEPNRVSMTYAAVNSTALRAASICLPPPGFVAPTNKTSAIFIGWAFSNISRARSSP